MPNGLENIDIHRTSEELFIIFKHLIEQGYSINDLSKACPDMNCYDFVYILLMYGENDILILNAIKNYYDNLKIENNRCLIIADTHIGRLTEEESEYAFLNNIYQNEKGLYYAYSYASQNNIKNIIHLGDLIEGNADVTVHRIIPKLQTEYLKRIYPYIEDAKTFLLLGNHDYNAIYFGDARNDFYKVCKNIKLIGVNYSFINFNGNRIKLSHECKLAKFHKNINLPYTYEFAGHSHEYSICEEEKLVKAPSLSCVSHNIGNTGFLELIDEGDTFRIKLLDINGSFSKENILVKRFDLN